MAVARIFELKERPHFDPLIVHIADMDQLKELTSLRDPRIYELAQAFWPGPLTLIFKARLHLPTLLTAGTATVGVRQSSHPFARQLLRAFGRPITATSANISGYPAATDAYQVKNQFGDTIDMVFDGGRTPGEGGSTIIGLQGDNLKLIRQGIIPYEDILKVSKDQSDNTR